LWQGAGLDIKSSLLYNEEYHPIFLNRVSEYGITFNSGLPINIGDELIIILNSLNIYCTIYASSADLFKGIFHYPIDMISILNSTPQGNVKE